MKTRKEKDALGTVEVTADSYGGSFTQRALENFQISSLRAYPSFKWALGTIKKAAAKVNGDLGELDGKLSDAIQKAADEFLNGDFDADFDLDVYQAGAGTPFNMNVNEILANRANEHLGGEKGSYKPVHPNDHVNKGQSSNDVIPTALRLAANKDLKSLLRAGSDLINAFEKKTKEFKTMKKVGRTHLQDAVPITLGDEFGAYASAVRHALARLDAARHELLELGIGGTAVGSGLNAHPEFSKKICKVLSEWADDTFKLAPNLFETTHSMAAFASVSSALSLLAIELFRISNDLRLMASGPRAGFNEILLPEVEPGSSIMPGKVNPSVLECLNMICVQVQGLDHAIRLSAGQGQLELNWHTPLIAYDLLHQIEILGNGMKMFAEHCVNGIVGNEKEMLSALENSTALATALVPKMGYAAVAEIVHKAIESKRPFTDFL